MHHVIVPDTFVVLLTALGSCFTTPSAANFQLVIAGWVHCLGRRTITAVALASGAVGTRHVSAFHRFFARARWDLDALGRVLFTLAVAWIPTDQPLYVLVDDTLARKSGKCIALGSMHHDPLLSTGRKPFFHFGHVWVVLALWVPLPMGGSRGFALPLLFRLYVGAKPGGKADAPSRPGSGKRHQAATTVAQDAPRRTKLELARDLIALVAQWAGERTIFVVCDSAYAASATLDDRPAKVHVISRLRMDAALWTSPPPRRPRQPGRPRKKGRRLPNPQAIAAQCRKWRALPVTIYGREVTTRSLSFTALWYKALPTHPIRIVVVRDPAGKRKDEAFFCTDLTTTPTFILEGFARRWTIEVTFHDSKQFLGFEHPQSQAKQAVLRTAPMAFVVYDLVLLWYAGQLQRGAAPTWVLRPWYRRKSAPSFLDMLTALRQTGWLRFSEPSRHTRATQNSHAAWTQALLATA
jgi:SRSO17 transposase